MTVYHVSEQANIEVFEPRVSEIARDVHERFLGSSHAVVAIEARWFECVRSTRSTSVECIDDAIAAILRRGVELRVLPNLWALRDAVVESTLEFSIIRWRNAQPRLASGLESPKSEPVTERASSTCAKA